MAGQTPMMLNSWVNTALMGTLSLPSPHSFCRSKRQGMSKRKGKIRQDSIRRIAAIHCNCKQQQHGRFCTQAAHKGAVVPIPARNTGHEPGSGWGSEAQRSLRRRATTLQYYAPNPDF